MSFEANIVADSVSPAGIRLTTFQLRYPRFIHAELMTHRVFSRNASSSRAIPVKKLIQDIKRDPAYPVYWGSNKPGMQAGVELEGRDLLDAKNYWQDAMWGMITQAEKLVELGLHKQIANRILEPWSHINVVVTSTSWENFYTLRRHKDAQPEIKVLADLMWEAHQESTPAPVGLGAWHLPFITDKEFADRFTGSYDELIKVSVARCARVSYLTHDGRQTTVEEDIVLYERLLGAQPLHASPAEHQATPDEWVDWHQASYGGPSSTEGAWAKAELHGNLHGWIQHRKTLDGEFIPG